MIWKKWNKKEQNIYQFANRFILNLSSVLKKDENEVGNMNRLPLSYTFDVDCFIIINILNTHIHQY